MTPQERKVMEQALEALEDAVLDYSMGKGAVARHCEAITALRQCLEQQPAVSDEPVAWDCCANCMRPEHEHIDGRCPAPFTTVWHAWDYKFPPAILPKPPIVSRAEEAYEAAKQREWVGLRPDEIGLLWDKYSHTQGALGFARAIEAKLKEKNT